MTKYIFVTGGVVSGLGKGITAASLGMLLKAKGLKVVSQKLDPYINIDPGTMSPYQHGEVFVTEDGAETDLDLGHYERFIDENLNKFSNLTTGKVYWNVLNNERNGVYNGETVQVIPHITNEIKRFVYSVAKKDGADVVITEIGGTIGDIESLPFLEAIRQVGNEVGRENCIYIHVTLVPVIKSSGEVKSKPTQHSVKELQSLGIQPDLIVCRSDGRLDSAIKKKIALTCNVYPECVIENRNVGLLYEAPLMLEESNICEVVSKRLSLPDNKPDLTDWLHMIEMARARDKKVTIAICGKYTHMFDTYLSIIEALTHGGIHNGAKINIDWVDSEKLTEENCGERLGKCDGILVPGGFGDRGIEGMIIAAKYARTHKVPYFGICLGMQIAVIEFARNVAGLKEANSREFDHYSPDKVIDFMEGQMGMENTGGTMRLGAYECEIAEGTLLSRIYDGAKTVFERHRHRFEFNNAYRKKFTDLGLVIGGRNPQNDLVESVELPDHPFYIGVQYHPEFKSRPHRPQPIFKAFVAAALANKRSED